MLEFVIRGRSAGKPVKYGVPSPVFDAICLVRGRHKICATLLPRGRMSAQVCTISNRSHAKEGI